MNEFWRKLCDEVGGTDYISQFADPSREILNIDNYTYSIDGNTLSADITATAPQSFNLIMDSDSDFVCTYLSGFGRSASASLGATTMIINPAMLVQVTDRASARTWFNRASGMAMLCGQGGFPFLLTSPRVIKPRTTLNVTAISAQAVSFTGFYMCFHGSRIYYK